MSLYRCAACGSPNVVKDSQAGGVSFNYKKGIVGTVVLGAGGAAAGIENKTQVVYKCPDCGITLTYPMAAEEKAAIDAGVRSATARENLSVYGIHTPWTYFTKKYAHIESGFADEEIKRNEAHAATIKEINTQTMRSIADAILEDYQSYQVEVSLLEHSETDVNERQANWEAASKNVLEARQRENEQAEKALRAELEKALEKIGNDTSAELADLSSKKEALAKEAEELNTELPSLGLFKWKRKKEINERLLQIEGETVSINEKKSKLDASQRSTSRALTEKMEADLSQKRDEIDKKYPLEESPIEHKEKLLKKKAYLDYIRENGQYIEKKKAAGNIVVYKFIELMSFDSKTRIALSIGNDSDQNGNYYTYPCSDVVEVYGMLIEKLSEIVNLDLTCTMAFTEQAVALALRELSTDGALNIEEIKRKKYYFISK